MGPSHLRSQQHSIRQHQNQGAPIGAPFVSIAVPTVNSLTVRGRMIAQCQWERHLNRYRKPEKFHQIAQARTCLTKAEYGALGRLARLRGKAISAVMRELIQAELANASAPERS